MKLITKTFKKDEEIKEYWDKAAYDILSILLALNDMGLEREGIRFAFEFGEPNLMNVYRNFAIDFKEIKKHLGIPEEFLAADTVIAESVEAMVEPKREVKTLLYTKEEMQERFATFMQEFQKYQVEMFARMEKLQKELLSKGILNPKDLEKPEKLESEIEKFYLEKAKKESEKK